MKGGTLSDRVDTIASSGPTGLGAVVGWSNECINAQYEVFMIVGDFQ